MQAILYVASVLMANDLHYKIGSNFRSISGAAFVIYAMLI